MYVQSCTVSIPPCCRDSVGVYEYDHPYFVREGGEGKRVAVQWAV